MADVPPMPVPVGPLIVVRRKIIKPKKVVQLTKPRIGKKYDRIEHPPTAVMVNNAIYNLKERDGSSLQAIKKYISTTYRLDAEKKQTYIKKYILNSVAAGSLIQTKGKGINGSFKLAEKKIDKKPEVTEEKQEITSEKPEVTIKEPEKKSPVAIQPRSKRVATATETAPKSPAKTKGRAKAQTKKPKAAKSLKKTSPKNK